MCFWKRNFKNAYFLYKFKRVYDFSTVFIIKTGQKFIKTGVQ